MFLACPACESKFRVNPHAVGEGRDVRCSKCGNEWFALKSDIHDERGLAYAPPPPAKPEVEEEEEAPPARPQPVPKEYEPQIGMPLGDELPSAEELAEADRLAAASSSSYDDDDEDEDEDEELDEPRVEEPLPDIDFDALDKAIASSAPVFKAKVEDTTPRRFLFPLAIICLILLILNIITAMLFFREPILRTVPATQGIYNMFGYRSAQGLSFSALKLSRYGTPELPRFDISGDVLNGSDLPRTEPDIRIAMVGKDGELIREWQMSGGDKPVPKGQPLPFSTKNKFLRASRSAEAEALILQLGSPLELKLSDQ